MIYVQFVWLQVSPTVIVCTVVNIRRCVFLTSAFLNVFTFFFFLNKVNFFRLLRPEWVLSPMDKWATFQNGDNVVMTH